MTPIDSKTAQDLQERVLDTEGARVRLIFYWDEAKEGESLQLCVLAVVDEPVENWLKESTRLLRAFDDFSAPVSSVHVFGEREFEQNVEIPGSLPYRATHYATRLYERPAAQRPRR